MDPAKLILDSMVQFFVSFPDFSGEDDGAFLFLTKILLLTVDLMLKFLSYGEDPEDPSNPKIAQLFLANNSCHRARCCGTCALSTMLSNNPFTGF